MHLKSLISALVVLQLTDSLLTSNLQISNAGSTRLGQVVLDASSTEQMQRTYVVDTFAKNLKTVPGITSKWKEQRSDLSEMALLRKPDAFAGVAQAGDMRSSAAIDLAYKRCEHVTKLFSKTFYMGTSLMRQDARRHVWAIYAWCRRTDGRVYLLKQK